ncbi:uncharacterized protein LOC144066187 isoform X2 [Stigmatopora argus]
MTGHPEGYETEEECALSDPRGESDADADIEDGECRLQVVGSLQRISSRRRKRQRPARQDTTESEDDGGRRKLRLGPDEPRGGAVPEESISQVRPLVIAADRGAPAPTPPESRAPSPPLVLAWLVAAAAAVVVVAFLLPWWARS